MTDSSWCSSSNAWMQIPTTITGNHYYSRVKMDWTWVSVLSLLDLRFLTVVIMKSTIFWDVMPCSKIEIHKYFGEIYHFHLKDQQVNQASNKQAASSLSFLLTDWYTWSAVTWYSLP
jgi:hypothetical protein